MPRPPKYTPVAAPALAPSPLRLFTGTSGWAYPSWKPGFYPQDVPPKAFLHFYASKLTAVEVNYTFRALPTPEQLHGWIEATPPGFLFAFKAPQSITHMKRLHDSHEAVAEFIAALEPMRKARRLGPLLFQLPPNFKFDCERLAQFVAAPALSRRKRLSFAFEFRHPSWFCEETYSLLKKCGAALCVAESEDLATPDVITAPFRYYRLRCPGGYSTRRLNAYAQKLLRPLPEAQTFVFFKHEDAPTGALNALHFLSWANHLSRESGENA